MKKDTRPLKSTYERMEGMEIFINSLLQQYHTPVVFLREGYKIEYLI